MTLTKDRILYGPHRSEPDGESYGPRTKLRCRLGLHRFRERHWYSVGDLAPGESVGVELTSSGPAKDGRELSRIHEWQCEWCFERQSMGSEAGEARESA
jgi:hypothetical protein